MSDATARAEALGRRIRSLSPGDRVRLRDRVLAARRVRACGADAVAAALAENGIRWVAGVAGTPVDRVFTAAAREGCRLLGMRSQAGAVFLAGAAAWWSGRLEGAVVVSAGPAIANTLAALLVARDNGWPVLVLGGVRSLSGAGTGQFQEWDPVPVLAGVAKWAITVGTAAEIPSVIARAIRMATAGRPGPVFLALPEDVLQAVGPVPDPDPSAGPPAEAAAGSLPELAGRLFGELTRAKRPVVVLGEGCRWSLDPAEMRAWVDAGGPPCVPLGGMRGWLPDGHSAAAHLIRPEVLSKADWILVAGARFDWRLRFGGEIRAGVRCLRADWDAGAGEVVPEGGEAFDVDPGRLLAGMAALGVRTDPPSRPGESSGWRRAIADAGTRARQEMAGWGADSGVPLSLATVMRTVRGNLPPRATIVLEGNLGLEVGRRVLDRGEPLRWMDPGWNGCLGGGVAYAMAARLTRPAEPVVLVTGDFSLGLALMELETAVRHALPVCVVLIHNGGNSGGFRQRDHLPEGYPERVHAYSPDIRYGEAASALGVVGRRVRTVDELASGLREGLSGDRPHLLEVLVDPFSSWPCPGVSRGTGKGAT